MKNIITISRQYGSGGSLIAKELSERLCIPYYNQEILKELSDDDLEEYPQDVIWESTAKLIKSIADKGPCIFLGRCADYILKNDYDILSVFIHADIDSRMKRAVTTYGINPDNLERTLNEQDNSRKAYYQSHTGYQWADANNYALCLDSGILGIEKCVDILAELF